MKIDVMNLMGEVVEQIDIEDSVFNIENVNSHAVYEAIKNHLANKRQGTRKAKTRAEVSGGGRKPWRQKGTGRARQGSIRSPQFIGGGVVFAKTPRDFSYSINKKTKKLAIKSVLTEKATEKKIIVLDKMEFNKLKTKEFAKMMKNLKVNDEKALVVTKDKDENVLRISKNLPNVKTTFSNLINTYDVMNSEYLVMTKSAILNVGEVFK